MRDSIVLLARITAESAAGIIALFVWFSLDDPFGFASVVVVAICYVVLRGVLVSIAALFFH